MEEHKVLIIEDELALQAVLKYRLKGEGFLVREAADGEEGLRIMREWMPHAIILDILMPRFDGHHVLQELRGGNSDEDIPIIVLTNFADEPRLNSIRDVLNVQDSCYIKTDITLSVVVEQLKKIIKKEDE